MNKSKLKEQLETYKKHPGSACLFILVVLAAIITFTILGLMIIYILVKGLPHISLDMFSIKYTSENASVLPSLINTLIITLMALLIACPLGICSAIYLVEYAKRGNKFVKIIRVTTETLSGIPSIVYGLFGMLFFVTTMKMGYSKLAGALTVAIMILPLVMRTTEEALQSVSDSYREGSFGLGAGKLRTIAKVVLPSAIPGILAGVILGIGRIVGETAALIYTAGSVTEYKVGLMDSGSTLAVHMYNLSREGLYMDKAYATAVVLLVLVVFINMLSNIVAKSLTKNLSR